MTPQSPQKLNPQGRATPFLQGGSSQSGTRGSSWGRRGAAVLQCPATSFLCAAPNVVAEWGGGGTLLLKSITVVKLRASLVSL